MITRFVSVLSATSLFLTIASATSMLRLTQTAVGPVSVGANATTAAPLVEAYNAGERSLLLGAQSSAAWLTATIGAQKACTTTTLAANCIPIQIQIHSSGRAASTTPYTGVLTAASPNAIDAPQTITVTAAVRGTVPSAVNVHAAPGGAQVNVTIREDAPPGSVDIKIMFRDGTISNPMQIAVQ